MSAHFYQAHLQGCFLPSIGLIAFIKFWQIHNEVCAFKWSPEKIKGEAILEIFESSFIDMRFITPYAHFFVFHLHEQVHIHGNVYRYNMEGTEKANEKLRTIYYTATNRTGEAAKTILFRDERIDNYERTGN